MLTVGWGSNILIVRLGASSAAVRGGSTTPISAMEHTLPSRTGIPLWDLLMSLSLCSSLSLNCLQQKQRLQYWGKQAEATRSLLGQEAASGVLKTRITRTQCVQWVKVLAVDSEGQILHELEKVHSLSVIYLFIS